MSDTPKFQPAAAGGWGALHATARWSRAAAASRWCRRLRRTDGN